MIKREQNIYLVIIVIAALIMNLFMYFWQGITFSADSYRYIIYAQEILAGNWYEPHMIWYIHYAFFLIIFKTLFGTYSAIVPFQIILHIISCCYVFLIINNETRSKKVSFFSALIYILWFKIAVWNVFILTDSLFLSFSIITLYVCLKSQDRFKWGLIFLPLIYLIFFIRPVGFLFLLAMSTALLYSFILKYKIKSKWILAISLSSTFVILLLLIRMQSTLETTEEYSKGEVVYRASAASSKYNTTGLILDTRSTITNNEKGLVGILNFAQDNPVLFLDMVVRKLFFFTLQVRPYYSLKINLFLILSLLPIYILAIMGWYHSKCIFFKIFSSVYILSTIGMCLIISLDWDGRFFLPIFPMLVILAGIGLNRIIQVNFPQYSIT